MSAQVGYVGHHADSPGHPDGGQPGAAGRRATRPRGRRRPCAGRSTRRCRSSRRLRPRRRARAATYNSMQASVRQRMQHGLEFLASYTLAKGTTNNRGFYGVFGGTGPQGVTSATEGAYWQNTYNPEAEWGPTFHDVRHNFILSATYELPFGTGRRWGTDWNGVTECAARRVEARRDLPGAHGPADHRDRRSQPLAAGRARRRAAQLRGRLEAERPVDRPLARHQRVRGGARSGRSATARSASRARPATRTSTWSSRSSSPPAAGATPSSGWRRSTP